MSPPSTTLSPAGTAPAAPSATTGPDRAACSWRSQFAVLRACQMPFKLGLPSAVRGALPASAPLAVGITPSWRAIIKAAVALVNPAPLNRFRICASSPNPTTLLVPQVQPPTPLGHVSFVSLFPRVNRFLRE